MKNIDSVHREYAQHMAHIVGKERIYTDPLRCLAWGTDAGFYRLLPQVIVRTRSEADMAQALRTASAMNIPVTFRAAGTSLSGQAISDSVILVAGKSWEGYRILDDKAETIALQPGIIGQRVNEILKPYGRDFTPDPASKKAAMVGGIVINNASGMKCGVHANSDRMLRSARIILADGTVLDTADAASRAAFEQSHPQLLAELRSIREDILADEELTQRIRNKYAIKNVTGLNLLPFVMYDDVFDIIAHCMVGSEGTLAFLSEVTMATGTLKPYEASAMVYFQDIAEACRAVVEMRKRGCVQACELLDTKSLESVHDTTGEGLTALLLLVEAESEEKLQAAIDTTLGVLAGFKTYKTPHFSTDAAEVAAWWQMRSGVFPAVGGTRPLGTTTLIEDVAFHIENLPEATVEMVEILKSAGYPDACIYGHALEGNYHFIIAQSFETEEDVARYRNLMERIEHLVVDKYDGSLKAEHGTGRNMAPFVAKEWGEKAWSKMKRLKAAFDPKGILNEGVIFNDDPECYVKGMKPLPLTNQHVNRCIECGFCEPNCMSCGFTLSARQRIVVQREISRLKITGEDPELLKALEEAFRYLGNETCAGDGLCSTSCPMKINTSDMIHDIRHDELSPAAVRLGKFAAEHLSQISGGLRVMLACADGAHMIMGDRAVNALGGAIHKLHIPLWTSELPKPYNAAHLLKKDQKHTARKVVYFPSCINRSMGAAESDARDVRPLPEVFVDLCQRAGYEVLFPKGMKNLCCGMIWESKGMPETGDDKLRELEAALIEASENGKYPVVCDQSPCLHRMREHIKSLTLHEPAEFIHDYLSPHLQFTRKDTPVAVHITCSSRRMGLAEKIVAVAQKCSSKVLVPAEVGCCGFAGDKGFTNPELNAWGLRKLRPQIEAAGIKNGYSNSRTCEIGLSTNSGVPYRSIVYLVYDCTAPVNE